MKRRTLCWAGGLVAVVAALLGWDWYAALPEGIEPTYVGRGTCIQCHQEQARRFAGSDHDLAMDVATEQTVLGDFNDRELTHYGVTSRMFRRDGKFFVETEGPGGRRGTFEVQYVIGYRPLQQYITVLDRGRWQILPVSWDVQGRRWLCVSPDKPFGPDDPLHWTGTAQNWNHMCADCHTTNFAKNFDTRTLSYHSTFSEIDVSCEACHGPGSLHVELARAWGVFWDRRYGYGLARLKGKDSRPQLEACAPCHAHRRRIYPGYRAGERLLNHFSPSLLEENLYFPDGQIKEEVYVYGSFLQSLMYRKGVRCTDCHDPHSTRVKFPGNRLCGQCHLPAKYDTPTHHHHPVGSRGALCVECHMPERTYMMVDPRRDHSIRRPRPDLTIKTGAPNACNNCHTKPHETPQWAAEKIVRWYGPKRVPEPHYGELFHRARSGDRSVEADVLALIGSRDVGPIVQATAAKVAVRHGTGRGAVEKLLEALNHREPLVRAAAIELFESPLGQNAIPLERMRALLSERLADPFRNVRIEAARVLSAVPQQLLQPRDRTRLERALREYITGLQAEGDQAGAHVELGVLYANLGRLQDAVAEYRLAIRLDPAVAGPRTNLAQLLDQLGRADEATRLRQEELRLLERDARLLPQNAFLQYRVGLMRYLLGDESGAEQALLRACELEPTSTEFLLALTLLYQKQRRFTEAIAAAQRLLELQPENAMFRQLLRDLREAAAGNREG